MWIYRVFVYTKLRMGKTEDKTKILKSKQDETQLVVESKMTMMKLMIKTWKSRSLVDSLSLYVNIGKRAEVSPAPLVPTQSQQIKHFVIK